LGTGSARGAAPSRSGPPRWARWKPVRKALLALYHRIFRLYHGG